MKPFPKHFNHALGKMIHTREDYLKEMKAQGCEPYRPESVRKVNSKPYKPSQWAHEVVRAIDRQREKDPNAALSGSVRAELEKAKTKQVPKEIFSNGKDGFYKEDK